MMKIIHHRRNTIEELEATPVKYGVEIDIRTEGGELLIHHDPFRGGILLEKWIESYRHSALILNVKEDGLEPDLIDLMESKEIEDWFILDQSFPSLVRWAGLGERRCAVRVSEFEPMETALHFAGKLDWVWVDCFTKFPLGHKEASILKENFKIYLVSPELQGRDPESEIETMAAMLKERRIEADAICTKRPDIWERLIS